MNGTDHWIEIFIDYSKSLTCLVLPDLQDQERMIRNASYTKLDSEISTTAGK